MTNQQKQTYLRERINDLLGGDLSKHTEGNDIVLLNEDEYIAMPQPSLADVLRAIGKDSGIAIETDGQFGEITPDGLYVGKYPMWNLALPFSQQDEAVYDLLIDILK